MRILIDGPLRGVRNMAVDEALMRGAGERGLVTLRFYRWEPGCLSFGRHQPARGAYDAELVAARGFDVVRRPTGGRAVFHRRELTYSVTAPADEWGSLREAYGRINQALAAGLRVLGVDVECAGRAPRGATPRPGRRACFRDPVPGEVTAGGRKLIGSAQWRNGGAFLQHGSLLLVDEQALVASLRSPSEDGSPADGSSAGASPASRPAARNGGSTGAVALHELLPAEPPIDEIVEALTAGFERELPVRATRGGLDAEESALADELEVRYVDPEWTWRR